MAKFQYQIASSDSGGIAVSSEQREFAKEKLARKPFILMVGMHLTKTRGGITTLTNDILNSKLKNNFKIRYLASQAEDFGKFRKALIAISAAIRFCAICLFRRPDLVYVHIGSNASLYRESAFLLLSRILGIRVISHFHAGDLDEYFARQPMIGQKYINYAVGLSERVIAVSNESGRQLRRLIPQLSIKVIPNAFDTSKFLDLDITERSVLKGEPVRLLFVGAVGKLKGEMDLIKALAVLYKEKIDFRISMIGFEAERLKPVFQDLGIEKYIDYLGPVAMSERVSFYKNADIFVLPTHAEAMPISVIEAMAAGLPVITTPVGGIPEIIDDSKEGFLVPVGNPDELAKQILILTRDRDLRVAMGKKARQRVLKQMDFARYIDQLDNEIRQQCSIHS